MNDLVLCVVCMSQLMRMMKGSENSESESSAKSMVPITRDLLGSMDSKEIVFDGLVPPGWESDFKSGNIYFKKCISSTSENLEQHCQPAKPLGLTNFPQASKQSSNLLDNVDLDLKLAPPSPPPEYQVNHVFTLDKNEYSTRKRSRSTLTSSSLTFSPLVEVGSSHEKRINDQVAIAGPNWWFPVQVKKPRLDLNKSP